jgi:hypothetical protein
VTDSNVGLTMTPSGNPEVVRMWVARSDSNDFRDSKWVSEELSVTDGSFSGSARRSGEQRVAVFGEAEYEHEGLTYLLSTLVFWK